MSKNFWIITVAAIGLLIGLFVLSGGKAENPSDQYIYDDYYAVQTHDHIYGSGPNILIEYADYNCSACSAIEPLIEQVREQFGSEITYVFRSYSFLSNSRAAHRAAEAAGMQGKYFEMNQIIYANQDSWSNAANPADLFEQYAQQIGLDLQRYQTDVASDSVNAKINADNASAKALDINSTPTFIYNGQLLNKVYPGETNPRYPVTIEEWTELIAPVITAPIEQ